jgi:hypothetical protein
MTLPLMKAACAGTPGVTADGDAALCHTTLPLRASIATICRPCRVDT